MPKGCEGDAFETAKKIYWNKWAGKHDNEELKEGIWLEPQHKKRHGEVQAAQARTKSDDGSWTPLESGKGRQALRRTR